MSRITDKMKKEKVISLYSVVTSSIPYTDNILARSQEILAQSKIRAFDALHIASAESTKINIMLTTDDKLEKACMKLKLHIEVMNPLRFIMEVMKYE